MRMKIDGVILRKGIDGIAHVYVQSGKDEVEIISSYAEDTIIDHWVNWSTVEDLLLDNSSNNKDVDK